jgi:hypothetical protein
MDPVVAKIIQAPQLSGRSQPRSGNPSSFDSRPSYRPSPYGDGTAPRGPMKCFGCGETGHGIHTCSQIADLINKGVLRKDQGGRITDKNGQRIPKGFDETFIQAIKRINDGQTHYISMAMDDTEDSQTDYYMTEGDDTDSDEEDNHVMAAERVPKKSTNARREIFDGVHMPPANKTYKNKDKENIKPRRPGEPTPFRVNKGPVEIVKSTEPIPFDARTPRKLPEDIVMTDSTLASNKVRPDIKHRSIPQESTELIKSKQVGRQSDISAGVGQTEVIDSILKAPITLTMEQLLSSSKAVTGQLAERMKLRNAKPTATVNNAMSRFLPSDKALLIKLPLQIGSHHVSAIVDTGSQLNIVRRDIYDKAIKVPMDPLRELVMNDANGGTGTLKGHVPLVELISGGVVTQANFYIGDTVPFEMLLGRPWQRDNFVSIDERAKGTYLVFKDPEGRNVRFELCVVAEEVDRSYRYNFMVPRGHHQSLYSSTQEGSTQGNSCNSCSIQDSHSLKLCPNGDDLQATRKLSMSDTHANSAPEEQTFDSALIMDQYSLTHGCLSHGLGNDDHRLRTPQGCKCTAMNDVCGVRDRIPATKDPPHGPHPNLEVLPGNFDFQDTILGEFLWPKWTKYIVPCVIWLLYWLAKGTGTSLQKLSAFLAIVYKQIGEEELCECNGLQSKQRQTRPNMAQRDVPDNPHLRHDVNTDRTGRAGLTNGTLDEDDSIPDIPLHFATNSLPLPETDNRFIYSTSRDSIQNQLSILHTLSQTTAQLPSVHNAIITSSHAVRLIPELIHGNLVEHGAMFNISILRSRPDQEHPAIREGHLFYTFYPRAIEGNEECLMEFQANTELDARDTDSDLEPTRPNTPSNSTADNRLSRSDSSVLHWNGSTVREDESTANFQVEREIPPIPFIPLSTSPVSQVPLTSSDSTLLNHHQTRDTNEGMDPPPDVFTTLVHPGFSPFVGPFELRSSMRTLPTPTFDTSQLEPDMFIHQIIKRKREISPKVEDDDNGQTLSPPPTQRRRPEPEQGDVDMLMSDEDESDADGEDDLNDEQDSSISEGYESDSIYSSDDDLPGYRTMVQTNSPNYLVPNLLPQTTDNRVRYYEVHTQDEDHWDYNDAQSTKLRQHGIEASRAYPEGLPVMIPPTGIFIPPIFPGHYPTRLHTEMIFQGQPDNHPPRYREMELVHRTDAAYSPISEHDEHAIANELRAVTEEMGEANDLVPDDPGYRGNIHQRITDPRQRPQLHLLPSLSDIHLVNFTNSPTILPTIYEYDTAIRHDTATSSRFMEGKGERDIDDDDEADDDEDGDGDDNNAQLTYWDPLDGIAPILRDNPWLPVIGALRSMRRRINTSIRLVAKLLLTSAWRDRIDDHHGDTNHYFYHHCPIFRYLESHRSLLYQGYYANCVHIDYRTFTPTVRRPLVPINPLLTAEEDEFFTQAANAFELDERGEMANVIRRFRGQMLPHDAAVRNLLDFTYLDPKIYTDCHGARRAIVWHESDL